VPLSTKALCLRHSTMGTCLSDADANFTGLVPTFLPLVRQRMALGMPDDRDGSNGPGASVPPWPVCRRAPAMPRQVPLRWTTESFFRKTGSSRKCAYMRVRVKPLFL